MNKKTLQPYMDKIMEAVSKSGLPIAKPKDITIVEQETSGHLLYIIYSAATSITVKIELAPTYCSFDMESSYSDHFIPENRFTYQLFDQKLSQFFVLIGIALSFRDALAVFVSNQGRGGGENK